MKLNEQIQLKPGADPWLVQALQSIARKVNAIASGTFSAVDGTGTAAPTTGTWALGDFVRNSAPAEAGSASSKYVVIGWICVTAGTPGTWVQSRTLTGN